MARQYEKEIEALKLLNTDWYRLSHDDRMSRHYSLLWTINALTDVGLVSFNEPADKWLSYDIKTAPQGVALVFIRVCEFDHVEGQGMPKKMVSMIGMGKIVDIEGPMLVCSAFNRSPGPTHYKLFGEIPE